MRADGDQYGIEALLEDLVQVVDAVVQAQIDAEIDDVLHFSLDDLGRQRYSGTPRRSMPPATGIASKTVTPKPARRGPGPPSSRTARRR